MGEAAETGCELANLLDAYARIDPPFPYWLSSDVADPSLSYCASCIDSAAKLNRATIDGGYLPTDSDCCVHCETCGALLDYTLTECGGEAELAHFLEHPPTSPLLKEEAYHIARMVEAIPENENAMEVARSALATIPKEVATP